MAAWLECGLRIRPLTSSRWLLLGRQRVTRAGAGRLPEAANETVLKLGEKLEVELELLEEQGSLRVPAVQAVRVAATDAHYFGLGFDWSRDARAAARFGEWLGRWGGSPETERRKDPRAANRGHPAFPRQVGARKINESAFAAVGAEYGPWAGQIAELSRGGLLIRADDGLALGIKPGDGLGLTLGGLELISHVRRISETVSPKGRVSRSFAVKLEWLDIDARERYDELLGQLLSP